MQRGTRQGGFSLLELLVVMGIMLTLSAITITFMNTSVKISTMTNEMTEAQQNLRTAQEFISRDLLAAGDGMQDIKSPRLPKNFMTSYISKTTVVDAGNATLGVMGIITSDDQVPAGVAVPLPTPAVNVKTGTDRITIMQMDPTFNNGATIALVNGSVTASGQTVTLPAGTTMTQFSVGDIYFFTSTKGSAFGCVTAVNAAARILTFATTGDPYGINQPIATGPIYSIMNGVTGTMMRMLIVHYFVDENGLLRKRVYGVSGGIGYNDMVVAEHVKDLQIRYILSSSSSNGNVTQPTKTLSTETLQGSVRQAEVTVVTETLHNVAGGQKQSISMTTGTSIRNMQFNKSLRPD
jgi:prepilin-type N-terminal cleavage/methylation domain-containing protein